jgi:Protein of unknown function (DUF4199)
MKKYPHYNSLIFRHGLITGLMLIIFAIIGILTNMNGNAVFGWIGTIIFIVMQVMIMRAFKESNEGYCNFGTGFGLCFLSTFIGGNIANIFNLVYMHLIDKNAIKNIINQMRLQLERNPDLKEEMIEAIVKTSEYMFQPVPMFFIGVLTYTILTSILALIVSAILKKEAPNPF